MVASTLNPTKRLADLYIKQVDYAVRSPLTEIGIWDSGDFALLNLKELMELRKEITEIISIQLKEKLTE